MQARLCSATLFFEAIAVALSVPVMIAVEGVGRGVALGAGLGLALVALLACGLLRRPGGYYLGHAVQVGAIALGLLVPVMFFIGAMFAVLWVASYRLGGRIEKDRAAAAASTTGG